ncbi:GDYXXLXY domain-containing protein [Pyramidobacter porci]
MKNFKYLAASLLPVLILLALPLRPACVSYFGAEVTLAVRPVDPRDLFRGDYVALSFEAESVPLALFPAPDEKRSEYAVPDLSVWYVALAPDKEGLWAPSGVFAEVPEGLYLKGTAKYLAERADGLTAAEMDYGEGLKRFYVKENTARELEEAARQSRLRATVKVWRGMAVIQSLEVLPETAGKP